ncbi:MAG: TRAP transporter large permease [Spirochaetales bacterium]|nr:TRAP transporter large permease [Spirochaetales bacterium]
MTPFTIGIAGCLLLFILLLTSLPVAYCMAGIGIAGFALIVSPHAAFTMMTRDLFDIFSSYDLIVIPLFVFMGQMAFHSGISGKLFDTAYKWTGSLPGGLAMATVGACTGFGAICGSGPATAATMSAVALPEMKRYNYSPALAGGCVAAGGSLGMLIPPSVVLIVYSIMTEQSIGTLFLAGILPGIFIAFLFCVVIFINCKRDPQYGPAGPRTSIKEKIISLKGVVETILLFVVVMGGMFLGFFTPTEAGAIGAAGSLIIAIVKRKLTFKTLIRSLKETIRTSCMILVIVAGAVIFGHFLAVTQIPLEFASWLISLEIPGWLVISIILLFYMFAGCFIDALALVLLTIPIFFPVIKDLGYNPVWFGIMIVVVTQMGVITPPVGVNVYVVSGMERDIPLQTIFKGTMPFLAALVFAAIILIIFPQLTLLLPNLLQ